LENPYDTYSKLGLINDSKSNIYQMDSSHLQFNVDDKQNTNRIEPITEETN
jgi:hypothetical protein